MSDAPPAGGRVPPDRVTAFLDRVAYLTGRRGWRSERVERVLLVLAVLIFAGATVAAWHRLPDIQREPELGWAALAAGLAALTLLLNAAEFGLSARLLGNRIPPVEGIRVSVLGSAANLLPIPGAAMVRTRALRQAGERSRDAIAVTGAVGIVWVGAAAALAGALLLLTGKGTILATIFLAGGVGAGVFAGGLARLAGGSVIGSALRALVVVELVSVMASGLRLYAVARAVDFDVGLVDAVTISLGAILSQVVGVFPGGLGLREVTSGLFGGLVGVAPSVGVLMSVADRIVLYVVLLLAVVVLAITAPRSGTDPAAEIEETHSP